MLDRTLARGINSLPLYNSDRIKFTVKGPNHDGHQWLGGQPCCFAIHRSFLPKHRRHILLEIKNMELKFDSVDPPIAMGIPKKKSSPEMRR